MLSRSRLLGPSLQRKWCDGMLTVVVLMSFIWAKYRRKMEMEVGELYVVDAPLPHDGHLCCTLCTILMVVLSSVSIVRFVCVSRVI